MRNRKVDHEQDRQLNLPLITSPSGTDASTLGRAGRVGVDVAEVRCLARERAQREVADNARRYRTIIDLTRHLE
jgi:hypothetical protein